MKLMCYCFGGIGYSVDIKNAIIKILNEENITDIIVDNCKIHYLSKYCDYDYFITGKLFIKVFERLMPKDIDHSKCLYINDLTPDSIKSLDENMYEQTKKMLIENHIIGGK